MITMSELDRQLGLARGTANQMRKRGVFEAEQIMGRLWGVLEKDIPAIGRAISDYRDRPIMDGKLVSASAAAKRLSVAQSTIYNLIRLGRLESVQSPNHRLFVTVKSVEEYRSHRLPPGVGIKLKHNRRRIG